MSTKEKDLDSKR